MICLVFFVFLRFEFWVTFLVSYFEHIIDWLGSHFRHKRLKESCVLCQLSWLWLNFPNNALNNFYFSREEGGSPRNINVHPQISYSQTGLIQLGQDAANIWFGSDSANQ